MVPYTFKKDHQVMKHPVHIKIFIDHTPVCRIEVRSNLTMAPAYNPGSSVGFGGRKKNTYDSRGHLLPSAAPTGNTKMTAGITRGMSSMNVGTQAGYGPRTQAASLRTVGTKAPTRAEDYQLGELVSVPHIVPSLDPNAKEGPQVIKTPDLNISKKRRFAVVVKIYRSRMIVLPVYSCQGNGLDRKPDDYKLTAVSIWNPGNNGEEYTSKLAPLCVKVQGKKTMKPGAHISLTEPVLVDYQYHIDKVDCLDPESTKKLIALYNAAQRLGEKPCAVHGQIFPRDIEYIINPAKGCPSGLVNAPAPPRLAGASWATGMSAATKQR